MTKYIFVEGFYDELFIRKILTVQKIENEIKIVEYSQMKDEKINRFLSAIKSQESLFLFIADEDGTHYSSTSSRIDELKRRYTKLSEDDIILVVPEIEGWYIAGLTRATAKKLKLKSIPAADNCTKERFSSILPNKKDGTEVRNNILNNYEIEVAMTNSPSFKEFMERLQSL